MGSLSRTRSMTGIVLFIALATLVACGNTSTAPTGAQILQKANAHLPKSGEYAMTGNIPQGSQDIPVTGQGKFIADPGQSSLTVTFTAAGVNTTVDVVADEDTVFIRESTNGKWLKDPVATFEENTPLNYEIVKPTLKGIETIQGVSAYHLTGLNNEGGPVSFWFRTDTYYPVQANIDKLGSGNFRDVTITYIKLDLPVTIVVPTAS